MRAKHLLLGRLYLTLFASLVFRRIGTPLPLDTCVNFAHPRYRKLWNKLAYNPDYEEQETEVSRDGETKAEQNAVGQASSKPGLPGNALKQATFAMDGLGEFEVTSYLDGFLVEFAKTREVIEVSHVRTVVDGAAQELIQVHSSLYEVGGGNVAKVRAVVADMDGRSFDCVVRTLGGRAGGKRPRGRSDDGTAEENVPLEVPCTIAAFGKTRVSELAKREGGLAVAGGPGRWLEVSNGRCGGRATRGAMGAASSDLRRREERGEASSSSR